MSERNTDIVVNPTWSPILDNPDFARIRYPKVDKDLKDELYMRVAEICLGCPHIGDCNPVTEKQGFFSDGVGIIAKTTLINRSGCDQFKNQPIVLSPNIIEHDPEPTKRFSVFRRR